MVGVGLPVGDPSNDAIVTLREEGVRANVGVGARAAAMGEVREVLRSKPADGVVVVDDVTDPRDVTDTRRKLADAVDRDDGVVTPDTGELIPARAASASTEGRRGVSVEAGLSVVDDVEPGVSCGRQRDSIIYHIRAIE